MSPHLELNASLAQLVCKDCDKESQQSGEELVFAGAKHIVHLWPMVEGCGGNVTVAWPPSAVLLAYVIACTLCDSLLGYKL